ncbi:response regulator [Marinoscillum pacificum]|uniref:response regulator n=1 Tax=Marinoscillum pacificum TaxID=392723 RepID=UPI0021586621|nr:response regulator [Marinoscillum pacificum]
MSSKVLIVDDEPNILMSLEFLLKKSGYQVFIARDGREALGIIDEEVPDIILLDVMMPEVDGYEVCQKVKNNAQTSHVKIIFLSAKTKKEDIDKGYEMGADLYITKPFSTRYLISQVDTFRNK